MFSLCNLLWCSIMPIHSKNVSLFFIPSLWLLLSFSLWQRRRLWCPIGGVIDVTCTPSSPHLDAISLLLSLSLHSLLQSANIFPLQAVWCSCLSVSHPLFWHLHAVKDRQKRHRQWQPVRRNKTCFDGVSCRPQNVRRTLYIKAIRILEAAVVRLETVELLQMVQVRCLET